MVFGGTEETDGLTDRYSTYGEAHKGHWTTVDKVKEMIENGVNDV